METKIKVSTEITRSLETVKPGDVVKSIKCGGVVLVIRSSDEGRSFDGFVLDKGEYESHEEKDFVFNFRTDNFEPFIGTITLECE